MKLTEVIEKIRQTKPNPYSDDRLTDYINALEQQVQAEVFRTPIAEITNYRWKTNQDTVLLIPPPYDSTYPFYVAAMIDFNNGEFDSYNQNMVQFNTLYDEYKKFYKRSEVTETVRFSNFW